MRNRPHNPNKGQGEKHDGLVGNKQQIPQGKAKGVANKMQN